MPAVYVSARAEADIDSIAEYTTNTWGRVQTDAYLKTGQRFRAPGSEFTARTLMRLDSAGAAPV